VEHSGDHPVIDFVATVAERRTTRQEKLSTPADLTSFLRQTGLSDEPAPAGDADLSRARAVREAAFALISAAIDATPVDPGALAVVNAAAAVPPPSVVLTSDLRAHRSGDVDALLGVLARDCVELVSGPDRQSLHWCADATCTRPFVDRSRGHRRRWCGMRGCGDRAKSAAYRRRRAAGS
jgi:predicted RNA-binding Zn ribbon-like protein